MKHDTIIPLALEKRATIPTREAAYHIDRAEQTLRLWACRQNGPILPIHIHGRLGWPVKELKKLVGVE